MVEQLQDEEVVEVEVLISARPQSQRGPSLAVHLNIGMLLSTEQFPRDARQREVRGLT